MSTVHCESTGKSGGSLREGGKNPCSPLDPVVLDRLPGFWVPCYRHSRYAGGAGRAQQALQARARTLCERGVSVL